MSKIYEKLWLYFAKKRWQPSEKFEGFHLAIGLIYSLIGFAVWFVVQFFAFRSAQGLFLFIGYSIVISQFSVFLYTCRHSFRQ